MVEHGAESLLSAIQTEKALDLRLLLKHPKNSQQTNESGLSHSCQHPNTSYRLMRVGSLDRWLPKNKLNKLINKWSQQREGSHLSKKLHKHQVINEGRAFTQPQ